MYAVTANIVWNPTDKGEPPRHVDAWYATAESATELFGMLDDHIDLRQTTMTAGTISAQDVRVTKL